MLKAFGSPSTNKHRVLKVSSEVFPCSINSQSLQLHTLSEVSQDTSNSPTNKVCFTPSIQKSYYIFIEPTGSFNPGQLFQHFTCSTLNDLNDLLSDSRKKEKVKTIIFPNTFYILILIAKHNLIL